MEEPLGNPPHHTSAASERSHATSTGDLAAYRLDTPDPPEQIAGPLESPTSSDVAQPGGSEGAELGRPQTKQLLKVFGWLSALLLLVLVIPPFLGEVQYQLTAGREQAEVDVARENLQDFGLQQMATAYQLLAQSVGPSVVSIRANRGRAQQQGSGVIVDQQGYIITNHHVVRNVSSVDVELSDGRRGSASVIGVDPDFDLAVLKCELDELIPARWGDSDELHVGEPVWAVGSPFGLRKSITAGIVSATERRGITPGPLREYLQTDAAVNPGNSGGPLINTRGEVVGINTAIVGEGFRGVSFAIPSNLTKETYEAIRKNGYVERGFLGVVPTQVPDRVAVELGLADGQGIYVSSMSAGTPAARAGLEPRDVILEWGGESFTDPTLLSRAIAATSVGSRIPVKVLREKQGGQQELMLEVVVGARPRR